MITVGYVQNGDETALMVASRKGKQEVVKLLKSIESTSRSERKEEHKDVKVKKE